MHGRQPRHAVGVLAQYLREQVVEFGVHLEQRLRAQVQVLRRVEAEIAARVCGLLGRMAERFRPRLICIAPYAQRNRCLR